MNKLNLGCGFRKEEGFINIDNDPNVNPDFLVSLGVDSLPFKNNTFEEVIASHILEHIGTGYLFLFKELYRVCKHGAIIHIIVPHHRSDWFYDDPTHIRPITSNSFQLFSKKYTLDHIKKYGSSNGISLKENIDFEIIEVKHRYNSYWEHKFKFMTKEDIQQIISEKNNVIIEEYIKLTVIKDKNE